MTGHKSFRCPVKPDTRRRCFRCGSSSHLKNDCENEVVCNFCRQTGHMIADCDENREHRVGWRFGARNEVKITLTTKSSMRMRRYGDPVTPVLTSSVQHSPRLYQRNQCHTNNKTV